jgi:hypothetical protein
MSNQDTDTSLTVMSDPHSAPDLAPTQSEKAIEKAPVGERGRAKIAVIMLALTIAVFLAALDTTIITTALETIAEDFSSSAGFTWIGSAYLLAAAASTPLVYQLLFSCPRNGANSLNSAAKYQTSSAGNQSSSSQISSSLSDRWLPGFQLTLAC